MVFRIYSSQASDARVSGYRQSIDDDRAAGAAALARGATAAAEGLERAYKTVRDEQDLAAVHGAYAELQENRRALLDDPEHGLVSRRGINALSDSKGFEENWQKATSDIRARLTPTQQRRFDAIALRETDNFLQSVNRHVSRESEVVRRQNLDAALSAAKSDAVGYARRGEIDKVSEPLAMALTALDLEAEREGWSSEQLEAQKRAHATEAYIGALDAMVETGNVREAQTYLVEAKKSGLVDNALLAKSNIEKAVAAAGRRDTARGLADQVWVEANGDPAAAAELLRSKEIRDTDLLDDAMQRVQQRGAEMAQFRRQADAPRLARLEQELRGPTGDFNESSDDFVRLSDEGKADALRMRDAEKRSRRAEASEQRRIQNEIDANLIAYYSSLPYIDKAGFDQVSIDLGKKPFSDGSQRVRYELTGKQKRLNEKRTKDGGVALSAFDKLLAADVAAEKMQGPLKAQYLAFMREKYVAYAEDPANETAPQPPEKTVRQWRFEALQHGEERREDVLFLQSNKRGFQFGGKPYSTAGFEERNRILLERLQLAEGVPAPEVAPMASGRKPRRTVNGETRVWNGTAWVRE